MDVIIHERGLNVPLVGAPFFLSRRDLHAGSITQKATKYPDW